MRKSRLANVRASSSDELSEKSRNTVRSVPPAVDRNSSLCLTLNETGQAQINMSNARNQRTCHRLLPRFHRPHPRKINYLRPRVDIKAILPGPHVHLIPPSCETARQEETETGTGRNGRTKVGRTKGRSRWTTEVEEGCTVVHGHGPTRPPVVFPTLTKITPGRGQRVGNYPVAVLYLLRCRREGSTIFPPSCWHPRLPLVVRESP